MNLEITKYKLGQTCFIYVFASLCLFFLLTNSFSQGISVSEIKKAREIINDRGEVALKFLKPANMPFSQISRMMSVDKVKHDTIYAWFNRKQLDAFLKLGIDFSVFELPQLQPSLKSTGSVWLWNKYPNYSEYLSMMDSFARAFPTLCRIIETGKSVKGRSILFARISSDTTKLKPKAMYSSSMHGNELAGYDLMLHLIHYLLTNYGINGEVTGMVDSLDIWINPLANPDGTFKGGDNDIWHATRLNADSIDLNRNFEDPIYGPHPEDSKYALETSGMMNLMSRFHFVLSANFHSGDEVVNYPWDSKEALHPDDEWFKYISYEYADSVQVYGRAGYFTDVNSDGITNGAAWYVVYGGRQDYITYFRQGREVTIELDQTFMTPESNLINLWNYNYRSLIHYLEQGMFGLRGFVTDSVSHNPVKAKIELIGHDDESSYVYSDSITGKFYRLINTGNYNIRFSAPGYITKEMTNVAVSNRQITWLDINLKLSDKSTINLIEIPGLSIYPNPCNRFLNLKGVNFPESAELNIHDITGKRLINIHDMDINKAIDISNLQQGIYLITVRTPNNYYKKVFLIQR